MDTSEDARVNAGIDAGAGANQAGDASQGGRADQAAQEGDGGKDSQAPSQDSVGLGVDLVEIERMRRILARTPRFRVRVYTEAERTYCDQTAQPAVHYATRFAAKEAVLKALGTGFSEGIAPADVEIDRNAKGRPFVRLHRRAREVASEQGVRELPVSLSYTHTDAVACAMAITEGSMRALDERIDPMEELAAQFKEARSMLDELPATGVEAIAEAQG